MALQAPIDKLTHQALRAAVLHLREGERRRRFPVTVHVGFPGHARSYTTPGAAPEPDHGLRCDVALGLLQPSSDGAPRPFAWLTRPGDLTVHEVDLRWGAAFGWASLACGVPTSLVVVTPRGWFDPVSGVSRRWQRLRRRTCDPIWPGQS